MTSRQGFWSAGVGFGVILDPDVPALQTSLDYFVTDDVAVGPLVQFGLGEDAYVLGISGQVKYSAPLAGNQKVRPYGHVGVGFAQLYYKDDDDHDSITTYLFPVGGGFEFELRPNFNLDIGGTFNVSEDIYLGIFAGVRFVF